MLPIDWHADKQQNNADPEGYLSAYCHCKAISFSITRPSALSSLPSSPYPDLLLPYHTTHPSKVENPDNEKWWLDPIGFLNPTHLPGRALCLHILQAHKTRTCSQES
ncbi:hypothetical protein L208DRAFT_1400740 [Tricholoma matsutake]|nr:hypothetical protein L208DRAFT_1400740 [Tricholoma matsutake 945]